MGKYSVHGYDSFYDFDRDGKLDAMESSFQLCGEQIEEDAIRNKRPFSYFTAASSHDTFCDDLDEDIDDEFDDDDLEDDPEW